MKSNLRHPNRLTPCSPLLPSHHPARIGGGWPAVRPAPSAPRPSAPPQGSTSAAAKPSNQVALPQPRSKRDRIWELSVRIAANGVLSLVAGVSLVQLVLYTQEQGEKLEYVSTEVVRTERQTTRLKASFSRYFDPWQTEDLIQEQSGYKSLTERPIVWTTPLPAPE